MLFKTVYGQELECIHNYLNQQGPVDRARLYKAFIPLIDGEMGPRANVDDALAFLTAGNMLTRGESGRYGAAGGGDSFKLQLLQNLRNIQLGASEPLHPLDPWYLGLLDLAFVRPNRILSLNLHQLANSLDLPELLSEEKVNAWRRVLEFIGLGSRLASGFLCNYRPRLVMEIISHWEEDEGPIQLLLEGHIGKYLPWEAGGGDIAAALGLPVKLLARWGHLNLEGRQDLPNRSYFGDEKIKWVRKGGGMECYRASRKAV